jgi:hypothetical protein
MHSNVVSPRVRAISDQFEPGPLDMLIELRGESPRLKSWDDADNSELGHVRTLGRDIPNKVFNYTQTLAASMLSEVATYTFTVSISNYSQMHNGLDALGFAASKLWTVGR